MNAVSRLEETRSGDGAHSATISGEYVVASAVDGFELGGGGFPLGEEIG